MSETPPVPPPPMPEIPRKTIWTILALPPLITAGANILLGMGSSHLSELTLLLPLVVLALIIGLACRLHLELAIRYRGKSLAFLIFTYLMGQFIVCLALWIGTCALFL